MSASQLRFSSLRNLYDPFLILYFWQAIGVRLNELCHSESESPANLLGLIYDEETKRRLRKEDEEEDFLDDSKETPFTTRTPTCKNLSFRNTYSFFFFFLFSFKNFFFWFPFQPQCFTTFPLFFFFFDYLNLALMHYIVVWCIKKWEGEEIIRCVAFYINKNVATCRILWT